MSDHDIEEFPPLNARTLALAIAVVAVTAFVCGLIDGAWL